MKQAGEGTRMAPTSPNSPLNKAITDVIDDIGSDLGDTLKPRVNESVSAGFTSRALSAMDAAIITSTVRPDGVTVISNKDTVVANIPCPGLCWTMEEGAKIRKMLAKIVARGSNARGGSEKTAVKKVCVFLTSVVSRSSGGRSTDEASIPLLGTALGIIQFNQLPDVFMGKICRFVCIHSVIYSVVCTLLYNTHIIGVVNWCSNDNYYKSIEL